MACSSCKKKNKKSKKFHEKVENSGLSPIYRVLLFFVKLIFFMLSLVIGLPIIIPFTIYMLGKVIFLNEGVDVTTGLVNFGKMITPSKDEDDDEDDDEMDINELEEDEIELMDVEDITVIEK